ncbi:protein chibby homolog 1-like [Watersipora subatra]|uniref:protein chibby homolog 1-like n=1 Tax=Watersipora subatra TaxID=2589382 RepID=UPI00355C2746
MPFGPFGNKFSPKKPGPRKAASLSTLQNLDRETLQRELSADDTGHKIRINLDGNKVYFDGKEWVSESGGSGATHRELSSIKKANEKLKEENNLLRLKLDILLDMLTKSTAEQHLQNKEIEDLKNMVRNKSALKSRS